MKTTKIHHLRGAAGAAIVTNAARKVRAHDVETCGCLNCRLAMRKGAEPLTARGLLTPKPKGDDKPLKAQGALAAQSRRAPGPLLPAGVLRAAS